MELSLPEPLPCHIMHLPILSPGASLLLAGITRTTPSLMRIEIDSCTAFSSLYLRLSEGLYVITGRNAYLVRISIRPSL